MEKKTLSFYLPTAVKMPQNLVNRWKQSKKQTYQFLLTPLFLCNVLVVAQSLLRLELIVGSIMIKALKQVH